MKYFSCLIFFMIGMMVLIPSALLEGQVLNNFPQQTPFIVIGSDPFKGKGNETNLRSTVTPLIDIKENRYAHWNVIIENPDIKESWFAGYHLTDNGTAFGKRPAEGAYAGQEPIIGYEGSYLVNSKRMNLGTTKGKLLSDTFTIKGDRIDFLIGGGNFGKFTSINLLIHDSIVRQTS